MSGILEKIQKPVSYFNDTSSTAIANVSETTTSKQMRAGDFKIIQSSESNQNNTEESKNIDSLSGSACIDISPNIELLAQELAKTASDILPSDITIATNAQSIFVSALEKTRAKFSKEETFSRYDIASLQHYFKEIVNYHGPLKPLIIDKNITEIYFDSYNSITVRKNNSLEKTNFKFKSPAEYKLYLNFILRRASFYEEGIDLQSGRLEFSLEKENIRGSLYSTENVISEDAKLFLKIARFRNLSFYDLLKNKYLPATLASWLSEVSATAEINILVVGPSKSRKKDLVSALLNARNSAERLTVIEEYPELAPNNTYYERLEFNGTYNARRAINTLDFAINRKPDSLFLDEIRGAEASSFLSIAERGGVSCISTIESNSIKEALWKFVDSSLSADFSPESSIIRRISRAFPLIIFVEEKDNQVYLKHIVEILNPEEEEFKFSAIASFVGIKEGKRRWSLKAKESTLLKDLEENHGIFLGKKET